MPPESTGYMDLLSYFNSSTPTEDPNPTTEVQDENVAPPSDPPAPADATPDTSPTTPADNPLLNPVVQATLDRKVQDAIAAQQRRQQEETQRRYLESLPDDQYGRIMRQHAAAIAQHQTVTEAAKAEVYAEGLSDTLKAIPELAKLDPSEAAKLDPRQFQSFGAFAAAVVDHAATARASRLAESLAKTRFDAWKAEESARLAKEYPVQPRNTHAKVSTGIDTSKMAGIDILRESFR